MDNIGIRLEVTDDQVTSVVEQLGDKAVVAGEKIKGIGTQSDATSRKISQGFKAQESAIIDSTRAADGYKRSIEQNKATIDRLNKSVNQERLLLLQLEKQYKKFGNTASKEAMDLKKQIDLLNASIKESTSDTKLLAQQNLVAANALDELANSGNKSAQQIKLTSHEALNFGYQVQDLVVQIGSGQGLFRPLLQQLPQMAGALGGSGRLMKFFGQQAKGALKSIFSLKGGVRLLLGSVVGLIALPIISFFTKSSKASEWLGKKIDFLSGMFGELMDRAFAVGEALFGWATGANEWADVADTLADSVKGIGSAMIDAGHAAVSYEAHLKRLKKEQEDFIVQEGKVLAVIDERRRAVDDEAKSFSSRKSALRETMGLEADLEKQRIRFAQAEVERLREAAMITKDGELDSGAIEEINKAERELIDLRREAASRAAQDEMTLKQLNNEAVAAYKERVEAMRDLQKQSESVLQQLQDMQNADAQGIDKIRIDTIKAVAEVGKLEESLRELYKENGVEFDLASNFEAAVQAVEQRGAEAIRDFERKRNLEEAKARQEGINAQREADLELIDQREELALALVDVDRKQGLTEIEAEQARTRQKLQIQIDYTRQRLALLEDQNSIEAALFRANIESLQQEIEGIGAVDLTAVQQLGERIRSALGLTQEEFGYVGDLFSQFGSTILDASNAVLEQELANQEKVTEALKANIQERQSAIDEQRKLQEQGFANDADLLEQKLLEDQAALEKAEAKKLALQKRQARAQLAIDSAQQASAYLTTVFNLLASESKKGIIGLIAVAAGGLALVGGIVAKAKSNAAQFKAPKFRDGTEYVQGPGTGTSDSIMAYLSRGERVVDFQKNQELGGATNSELVHYFKLGKSVANAPSFNNIDEKTAAAVRHGKEISVLEKEKDAAMLAEAYASAASKMSNEMINYWKSRPVTYVTPNGTVIEYEKGGVKVRQNIKKS